MLIPYSLNDSNKRYREIMHIDMDSFFVSVERVHNPNLRGKPVIVGGNPDKRGVVASASYEARKFGVKSAMPSSIARRLCPDAIFIDGHWELYTEASENLYQILCDYSPLIEMVSIDEAYVDLTGTHLVNGASESACDKIIRRIWNELHLPCSIGLASNKLVAKIASGAAKPHGFIRIIPGYEQTFLAPLHLKKLPGVGEKVFGRLQAYGLKMIGDLVNLGEKYLEQAFGNYGIYLYHEALGEDGSSVEPYSERKSVSRERTFDTDTCDRDFLSSSITYLSEKVGKALREESLQAKTITIKLRYSDFKTISRSKTLPYYSNFDTEIIKVAKEMFFKAYQRRVRIRLLGVSTSNLITEHHQLDIFQRKNILRMLNLYQSVDKIKDKYGFETLMRLGFHECGVQ